MLNEPDEKTCIFTSIQPLTSSSGAMSRKINVIILIFPALFNHEPLHVVFYFAMNGTANPKKFKNKGNKTLETIPYSQFCYLITLAILETYMYHPVLKLS